MRGGGRPRAVRRRHLDGRADEQDGGADWGLSPDRIGNIRRRVVWSVVHGRRGGHHTGHPGPGRGGGDGIQGAGPPGGGGPCDREAARRRREGRDDRRLQQRGGGVWVQLGGNV